MLKIGGHLSIAGGYQNALHKTIEIGGNTLQIFSYSPRTWNHFSLTDEQISFFVELKNRLKIDPIYFHASYLINLADPGLVGDKSTKKLIDELTLASKLQIKGSIVHLGSFKLKENKPTKKMYATLFANIQKIIENTPEDTYLIVENAGNNKICSTFEELAFIVNSLNSSRVRVCLDTCHLHSTGYDLSTKSKFDQYLNNFEDQIGLSKLELFQVNDSKDQLGSFHDRHENLGEGKIGLETFRILMTDPRTTSLPMILETPGFEKNGPDARNINILKNMQ